MPLPYPEFLPEQLRRVIAAGSASRRRGHPWVLVRPG